MQLSQKTESVPEIDNPLEKHEAEIDMATHYQQPNQAKKKHETKTMHNTIAHVLNHHKTRPTTTHYVSRNQTYALPTPPIQAYPTARHLRQNPPTNNPSRKQKDVFIIK
jgi:hypothetical protein